MPSPSKPIARVIQVIGDVGEVDIGPGVRRLNSVHTTR